MRVSSAAVATTAPVVVRALLQGPVIEKFSSPTHVARSPDFFFLLENEDHITKLKLPVLLIVISTAT